MSYELQGKLIEKFDTRQITDKFKKREFIVEKREESNGKEFIDTIKFQLIQDRCDLIDSYSIGEEIKVYFDIKGNKWEKEGKVNYFTNLNVWRIERVSPENPDEQMSGESSNAVQTATSDEQNPSASDNENDDLPF